MLALPLEYFWKGESQGQRTEKQEEVGKGLKSLIASSVILFPKPTSMHKLSSHWEETHSWNTRLQVLVEVVFTSFKEL